MHAHKSSPLTLTLGLAMRFALANGTRDLMQRLEKKNAYSSCLFFYCSLDAYNQSQMNRLKLACWMMGDVAYHHGHHPGNCWMFEGGHPPLAVQFHD